MATTELHKIPDTILSRCQEFQFRTIALQKIYDRLKLIAEAEKIDIADGALREIARAGEGSMRDAQSAFDQVISFSGESIEISDVITALGVASAEMLEKVVSAIAENKPSVALLTVDELIARGQDLRSFCRDLLALFRDLLMIKMASGEAEKLLDSAVLSLDELRKLAEPFSEADFIRFFNSLSETEAKLREANEPRYVLEIGLVKLIEMRRVAPLEKILERLVNLEKALANGNLQTENQGEKLQTQTTENPGLEKKSLNYDFPPDEVPFPVSDGFRQSETVQKQHFTEIETERDSSEIPDQNDEFREPENILQNDLEIHQTDDSDVFESNGNIHSNSFQSNGDKKNEDFSGISVSNFQIEDLPTKLPPLPSEELEHIEEKWLDAAFERKLEWTGDNLYPLKTASSLAEKIISAVKLNAFAANGNGAAAQAAKPKPNLNIEIPTFDDDFDSNEIPELPENPTDEQIREYAENHPVTKRIKRIFRGTLVSVERL